MPGETIGPVLEAETNNPEKEEQPIGAGPYFLAGKPKNESYLGDNTIITLAVWHGTPVLAPSSQLDRGLELDVTVATDEKEELRTENGGYDIGGIYKLEDGELITKRAYENKYGTTNRTEEIAA
ncbi:MAG: hypothetical protein BWY19_00379 [bacterium ADurb.Bin212]|nr:MAG: hypothetical protein BWY19_00379 [bacterium ADurb.Bin212]